MSEEPGNHVIIDCFNKRILVGEHKWNAMKEIHFKLVAYFFELSKSVIKRKTISLFNTWPNPQYQVALDLRGPLKACGMVITNVMWHVN